MSGRRSIPIGVGQAGHEKRLILKFATDKLLILRKDWLLR
jgi:hypothetical protein